MKAFSSMEESAVQAVIHSILCFHTSTQKSTLIYLLGYSEMAFAFLKLSFMA